LGQPAKPLLYLACQAIIANRYGIFFALAFRIDLVCMTLVMPIPLQAILTETIL
jgi:hypothetical protein